MRVFALLNWYDEPVGQLAATVSSLNGLCDGIIAVDGAYVMFPGGLRRPTSGAEQVDVIASTARALGMSSTIHQPTQPWQGNEVEKRGFIFRLAETVSTPEDWYFLIDADEQVTQMPADTRQHLEKATDYVAGEVWMWEQNQERTLPDGTVVSWLGQHPIRRLWRALRGIEVGPAHHQFRVGDLWLSDAGRSGVLAPALSLPDVRIEHRNVFRSDERLEKKVRYYADRDYLGIEKP
jgi:hypothetical protein